ncbi:hypothetical protein C8R45DRAFT_240680 [Mycena sanguinolenta]|nr:hypothetical protein C8R45DRAFT_240680 [Mycena sanguinolenta]
MRYKCSLFLALILSITVYFKLFSFSPSGEFRTSMLLRGPLLTNPQMYIRLLTKLSFSVSQYTSSYSRFLLAGNSAHQCFSVVRC